MTTEIPRQMKWWGWGDEDRSFDISDKPDLWPFLRSILELTEDPPLTPPVKIETIELPPRRTNQAFLDAMASTFPGSRIRSDRNDRLVHSCGKSFRDLWRLRHGVVDASPDVVIYPEDESEVCAVVQAAHEHGVVVIPFGGGSNIAGCLEPMDRDGRMVVSLDLKRMDRVLDIDERSRTARVQTGALGPRLESQLGEAGFTLGHLPDSFEHSTVGGWIATRSAGMQSDTYGKIEDMVLSLRMVTPRGTLVTRTVPKSSNGIDVNHVCIGSEGILGVITEATLQVHRIPEACEFYGYLFPDFESGVEAIYTCVQKGCPPTITRLNDAGKTALSFAYRSKSPRLKSLVGRAIKSYLRSVRKFDMTRCCLMILAFEGDRARVRQQRRRVHAIYRRFGGFNLGTGPGNSFERSKYDFPYLRDFVMDRGIIADVSETSTVWSNIIPLYRSTIEAIDTAIKKTGRPSWSGCHISHTYHSGASLYFTFGCLGNPDGELEQYLSIKKAAEDAFMRGGATLSHHHAVGSEHLPWIEEDISLTGVRVVRAIKSGLDPEGVMNPGKIIPSSNPLVAWGLGQSELAGFEGGEVVGESHE